MLQKRWLAFTSKTWQKMNRYGVAATLHLANANLALNKQVFAEGDASGMGALTPLQSGQLFVEGR